MHFLTTYLFCSFEICYIIIKILSFSSVTKNKELKKDSSFDFKTKYYRLLIHLHHISHLFVINKYFKYSLNIYYYIRIQYIFVIKIKTPNIFLYVCITLLICLRACKAPFLPPTAALWLLPLPAPFPEQPKPTPLLQSL